MSAKPCFQAKRNSTWIVRFHLCALLVSIAMDRIPGRWIAAVEAEAGTRAHIQLGSRCVVP